MLSCSAKPIGCLAIILFDAFADFIVHTKGIFGVRASLLCGFAEPPERLLFVGDSKPEALIEGNAQPELRLGHALLGGAPQAAFVLQAILICTLPADPIFRGSVTLVR